MSIWLFNLYEFYCYINQLDNVELVQLLEFKNDIVKIILKDYDYVDKFVWTIFSIRYSSVTHCFSEYSSFPISNRVHLFTCYTQHKLFDNIQHTFHCLAWDFMNFHFSIIYFFLKKKRGNKRKTRVIYKSNLELWNFENL